MCGKINVKTKIYLCVVMKLCEINCTVCVVSACMCTLNIFTSVQYFHYLHVIRFLINSDLKKNKILFLNLAVVLFILT